MKKKFAPVILSLPLIQCRTKNLGFKHRSFTPFRMTNGGLRVATFFLILIPILNCAAIAKEAGEEVFKPVQTQVIVRDHPRTGKPYVVIAVEGAAPDPFQTLRGKIQMRPDYRMLNPHMKSGQIPYQGPVSDRKKVYIFAASIATIGVAGGVGIIAAAPAATGAGASGGAGAYALAGTGVAAGTISTALAKTRPDPDKDRVTHDSESHLEKLPETNTSRSGIAADR